MKRHRKKNRHGKWSPIRFKSTWKEYRYGSAKPVSVAPIFKGQRRESAIDGVLSSLRDWRFSPFEHEGATRAGVRQALCLDGHDWSRSDAEAAALVSEGLRRIGAERPDWEEGQWHYAVPRENCARCGCEIDAEDQARGFRYCSDVCARAYRQHLSDEVPWDHELRRMGYWQVVISAAPVKTCPTCDKQFKSANPDAVYCSPACLSILQRRLEEKPCGWCNKVFRPSDNSKKYCSRECAAAHRVDTWKREAPTVVCEQCSSVFRPSTGNQMAKFCSPRCFMDAKNSRRRLPDLVRMARCEACDKEFPRKRSDKLYCCTSCSTIVSDFRMQKYPKALTLRAFDYMLKCEGVRITDDLKMAA